MKIVDLGKSRQLATQHRTKNKECFRNVMRVVVSMEPGSRVRYIEGYATTEWGIVMEHGWVEANGIMLEVTPAWLEALEQDKTRTYYPVLSLTRSQLCREVLKGGCLPFTGWQGRLFEKFNSEKQKAYWQAMAETLGPEVVALLQGKGEA